MHIVLLQEPLNFGEHTDHLRVAVKRLRKRTEKRLRGFRDGLRSHVQRGEVNPHSTLKVFHEIVASARIHVSAPACDWVPETIQSQGYNSNALIVHQLREPLFPSVDRVKHWMVQQLAPHGSEGSGDGVHITSASYASFGAGQLCDILVGTGAPISCSGGLRGGVCEGHKGVFRDLWRALKQSEIVDLFLHFELLHIPIGCEGISYLLFNGLLQP